MRFSKNVDDPRRASVLHNLCSAYILDEKWDEAEDCAREALDTREYAYFFACIFA